jgi:uncharacterized membrane protein YeiH
MRLWEYSPSVSAACSATFLPGQASIILRPELYVTAAALAAGIYVTLASFGVSPAFAAATAIVTGFELRAFAIVKKISLPSYQR